MSNIISITPDERTALSNIAAALKPLRNLASEMGVTLSLPMVETLLEVSIHPDKSVSELAKAYGVRNGTMGRWLSDLSDTARSGAPGLGLIDQRDHPHDSRQTRNRLSIKGRSIVQKVGSVMDLWCRGNSRTAA